MSRSVTAMDFVTLPPTEFNFKNNPNVINRDTEIPVIVRLHTICTYILLL